jgi:nucleotide-binding universal stress UspA family protein
MRVIAHTTDLTGDDAAAFVHAAALAAASGARLVTLHGNPGSVEASALPDATLLAARWDRAIEQRRICHECCEDVADTLLDALRGIAPALVVAGTHARHGLASLLHGSVAEALIRNLTVPTLVVPNHGRGFVDAATGALALARIAVAVAGHDRARGLAAAQALVDLAGVREVAITVLADGAPPGDADVIVSSHAHLARDADRPVLALPSS